MKPNYQFKSTLTALLALCSGVGVASAQGNNNGATIVIEQGATLVAESPVGGIEWPPQIPFGTAADDMLVQLESGEIIGLGIVIPPMTMTCVPGPGGPTYHSGADAPSAEALPAYVKFVRHGKETFIPVELLLVARNSEPDIAGDDLRIETEIVSMSLVMPANGHPDFTTVRLTSREKGSGLATGKRQHSPVVSNFWVDSSFEVPFDIEVVGAAGGDHERVAFECVRTPNVRSVLDISEGVGYDAVGEARVLDIDGCLVVDNLGSSGQDGVRLAAKSPGHGIGSSGYDLYSPAPGGKKGYDHYVALSASIQQPDTPGGLLGDGQSLAAFPFPPPPLPDFPDLPALSVVCTNSGGTVSGVCSSNAVRASEWVVEVWEGDVLKAVGTAADESACWSMPAAVFSPIEIHCAGATEKDNLAVSTSIKLKQPGEISISGNATPVIGDCVKVSPRDPKVLLGGVNELVLRSNIDQLCIEKIAFSEHGLDHCGVGNAVITPLTRGLLVDNLGSSGEDGISASHDDTNLLPYHAELSPLDIEGPSASFWISSLDAEDNNVATAEYRGGGGAGGRILVDYNISSKSCRVVVMNDGQFVGQFDVPLSPDGQTEVCTLGGSPKLTGCGKLRLGWPWELSCLVEEFDQEIMITPTGGTGLLGDEVRLLAPGATPQEVASISKIQMRASGIPQFEVCHETFGPDVQSPLLPPAPSADWEFPGVGTELVFERESYHAWNEAAGTGVCVRKKIRDQVLVSQQGNTRTYNAIMDVHLEGVGGLALSKDLELPGSYKVRLGDNPFVGEDVQQYHVELRELLFSLPKGADPEISRLSVGLGDGFASGGDVIVNKIPECELELQAILALLEQFNLSGTFGGGGDIQYVGHEAAHVVQAPRLAGGLAHMLTGQADIATTVNNGAIISNIGSSGEDGVSIQLPDVESFEVALASVELQPGGHLSFESRGQLRGGAVGVGLGHCLVTRGPAGEDFYDLTLAGPSSNATSISIYNNGRLVGSYPGGLNVIRGHSFPGGGGQSKMNLYWDHGRSSTPGNGVRFENALTFRVNGQPDAVGDEVRLLAHGVEVDHLSSFQMRFANTVGDVEIVEEAMGHVGREIVSTRGALATDHNSSRSNKTSSIVFDPDPDDDNDDDNGVLEMRAPVSGILDGRRQLWPMTCHLDPHYVSFDRAGSSLRFDAHGTINGDAEAPYGGLEIVYNGSAFELRGDFDHRGTNSARIVAKRRPKRIDQATPLLALGVPTGGGITSVTIRTSDGSANLPLVEVSAVPELYEPPFEEIECSYRLLFSEEVEITIGDNEPYLGHEIEVRLENPTFVSQDIYCIKMSGEGVKPLLITGIGTGPFYGQGLSHASSGGAQIEEADPGSRGPLIVSNIGSSGDDGVSIELDRGEGFWQEISPLDVTLPGRSLRAGIYDGIDDDCNGIALVDGGPLDDDCDLILADLVGSGEGMAEVILSSTRFSGNGAVVGTLRGSGFGTSVAMSTGRHVSSVGNIAPQAGGKIPKLIGYGTLPGTVIPGVGYVGESVVFEFDQAIVFAAADGGSIVCDTLRICPDMGTQSTDPSTNRVGRLRISNIPQMQIMKTHILHLDEERFESLGVTKMVAFPGELQLDNLGSSGQDGVRIPVSELQNESAQIKVGLSAPSFGTLTSAPHGFVNGAPDSPLGESTISASAGRLSISADFSSQSAPNVQVFVCSVCCDDDCDGDVDLANGNVAEIFFDPASPVSVVGHGYIKARSLPGGGVRPAGIMWEFDRPVEILAPGGEPGTGSMGRFVILTPSGGPTTETSLQWLDLFTTDAPAMSLLAWQGGSHQGMSTWLEENFSVQEINQLAAADYALDLDDDGYSEVDEFILGLDPRRKNGKEHRPSFSMEMRDRPEGGRDTYFRMSFEFDPTREGVRHDLEISPSLSDWLDMIVAPDMWRLVGEEELGTGNHRQTWERTEPMSAHAAEYYRHRGHVTILK